jgi:hypothetical protein
VHNMEGEWSEATLPWHLEGLLGPAVDKHVGARHVNGRSRDRFITICVQVKYPARAVQSPEPCAKKTCPAR